MKLRSKEEIKEYFNIEWILEKAESSLKQKPVHITDVIAPMSEGGPNDYYSNGDYWWPNPKTPDGLPYINRDGQSNPDNFNVHRMFLRKMRTNVSNLAAGYLITKNEKFAEQAVTFLKEFFLDEETRMTRIFFMLKPFLGDAQDVALVLLIHCI